MYSGTGFTEGGVTSFQSKKDKNVQIFSEFQVLLSGHVRMFYKQATRHQQIS